MVHPLVPLIIIGGAIAVGLANRKKGGGGGVEEWVPPVEFVNGCTKVVVRDQARADAEWDAHVKNVLRYNPNANPAESLVRWLESVRGGVTCITQYSPQGEWALPAASDFPSTAAAAVWVLFYNRMVDSFIEEGAPVTYAGSWDAMERYGLTEDQINAVPVEYL